MNDATMKLGTVARATVRKLAEEELARLFDGAGDPPLGDMGALGAMERWRDELVAEVDSNRADILLVEHGIHGWGDDPTGAREGIAEYETHIAQLRDIIVASITYLRARSYHERAEPEAVCEGRP